MSVNVFLLAETFLSLLSSSLCYVGGATQCGNVCICWLNIILSVQTSRLRCHVSGWCCRCWVGSSHLGKNALPVQIFPFLAENLSV